MARSKIVITLEDKTLGAIDRLVFERRFLNRSQAIQEALDDKLSRMAHSRLAHESAKLDLEYQGVVKELAGVNEGLKEIMGT